MTIETKYNIGDEVWFYDEGIELALCAKIVFAIKDEENELSYYIEGVITSRYVLESEIFPTKEELLKSL